MTGMKIVLQGGGAKLLTLLSAVHGIQRLAENSTLTFDEISGSSAGSIAGLVLALGLKADTVRKHFATDKIIEQITKIQAPSTMELCYIVLRGRTILDDGIVRHIVYEIFKLAGIKDDKEIVSLRFPLKVTVTDIHNQEVDFFDIDKKSLKDAVQTIVDSCALPLIFRNHNAANSDKADGGLFENFPTSKIIEDYDPNHVIGLSFAKERPTKPFRETDNWTLSQYVSRVISTAINSNITASLRMLPQENIIELPTDFDTLDFSSAATIMLTKEKRHLEISDFTYSKFATILEKVRQENDRKEWIEKTRIPFTYDQMRQECSRLLQMRRNDFLDLDVKVYVELNSHCSPTDPAYKNGFDTFYQKATYTVPNEGLDCLGVIISEYENEAEFSMYADIIAKDASDNRIPLVVLPAKSSILTKGFKALVIFFERKLLPEDTPTVTLIQRELLKDQFSKINTEGMDFLEYSPATQGKIQSAKIAIGVPAEKAKLYSIDVASGPYSEESKGIKLIGGRVSSEFSWLDEISTPGMSILAVETDETITPDTYFTVLVSRKL